MHGSRGQVKPTSPHLSSEHKIIAELAKATVLGRSTIRGTLGVADYSRIRDAIAATYPDIFHDFNARMWTPGDFHRPLGARERKWNTKTGKANFITPSSLAVDIDTPPEDRDIVQLITLRSNGQSNTTVYTYDDRFRGIYGSRHVVLTHKNDIDAFELKEGSIVTLTTAADDGVKREVGGLRVVAYNIPEGCIAAYYPECNPLLPLWHHEKKAKTPAAKSIPVRVAPKLDGIRKRLRVNRLLIDVVGKHVPRCGRDRGDAVGTLHQGDLALLLMSDSVRHDAQARIAITAPGLVGHLHRALVVQAHHLDEQPVELLR